MFPSLQVQCLKRQWAWSADFRTSNNRWVRGCLAGRGGCFGGEKVSRELSARSTPKRHFKSKGQKDTECESAFCSGRLLQDRCTMYGHNVVCFCFLLWLEHGSCTCMLYFTVSSDPSLCTDLFKKYLHTTTTWLPRPLHLNIKGDLWYVTARLGFPSELTKGGSENS